MRRPSVVVTAALAAAAAAAVAVGSAGAQVVASITVLPVAVDPGGMATVTNGRGSGSVCPPPAGTDNPLASVDLFTAGSATPVNRAPYQGVVTASGTWTVEVRLAPDLPPGQYRVEAGCFADSSLNSRFGPAYQPGQLDLRLQQPGAPTVSSRRGRAGEGIEVTSGDARCSPPTGSTSPRVRVSLLDAAGATRAEAESPVEAVTGRWSVDLRVPDLPAQDVEITAVCLARVGAQLPYARYRAAPFALDADPVPTTVTTEPPPTTTPAPGASTTAPPTTASTATTPTAALPSTPLAVAIVAEPTYTG